MEVRSPDRTVTITQTCGGEIVGIDIAAGAFDKHDERSFAKVLESALTTARRAGREAAEQLTQEVLEEQEARRGV
ncbi:MAG: YbaB/EbfC family nucleoid-associated protein [Dehalococcoidia bacterium]